MQTSKPNFLKNLIYKGNNPYQNIENNQFYNCKLDMTGGGSLSSYPVDEWMGNFFKNSFSSEENKLFIEVGSFLGESANTIADLIKNLNLNAELLCVDTWTGSTTHWEWYIDEWNDILQLKNGFPTLYDRFLCTTARNQDIITPFPIGSVDGAVFLKKKQILADFIFIDASHEEHPVYGDLVSYWEILKPGGFIIGDDFFGPFDGIKKSLDKFCINNNKTYEVLFDKFYLIKK